MVAKSENPSLPQDEAPQPGWSSEAQRLRLGATRTVAQNAKA
jgi:hypothetical protein